MNNRVTKKYLPNSKAYEVYRDGKQVGIGADSSDTPDEPIRELQNVKQEDDPYKDQLRQLARMKSERGVMSNQDIVRTQYIPTEEDKLTQKFLKEETQPKRDALGIITDANGRYHLDDQQELELNDALDRDDNGQELNDRERLYIEAMTDKYEEQLLDSPKFQQLKRSLLK